MRTLTTALVLAPTAILSACSSGLGSFEACTNSPVGSESGNVTTGLFFGFQLFSPVPGPMGELVRAQITNQAAAGGVIDAPGGAPDRQVAFYVFETDAPADDAGVPGSNRFLDRDGLADTNGVSDIFVAAVVEDLVDQSAFSYSLAGKFRHARCVSCHSLSREPGITAPATTVFLGSTHPEMLGAPQPGSGSFQNTNENSCLACHQSVLDATGGQGSALNRGWRNPIPDLTADFRLLTTAELADRARNAADDHFARDRRVTWALAGGIVPSRTVVGGPFGPADDDHDGLVEPFDGDGRRRTVPGGRAAFLGEIGAFLCGGPNDTRRAIVDVALVSRNSGAPAQAPNAASVQPDAAYVPDPAFDPAVGGVAGALYIVYASAATDIVGSAVSGDSQVYRATLDVLADTQGNIRLTYNSVELVSRDGTGMLAGNNDSSRPAISSLESSTGAANAGARVAFVSSATNIGGPGSPGAILVRDLVGNEITRVSEASQVCSDVAIDPSGRVVAFVTDDAGTQVGVSDVNLRDDVYFSRLLEAPLALEPDFPQRASQTNGAAGEGDVNASFEPDVILQGDERILVAFTSQNELDAAALPSGAGVGTNIFLHDFVGVPNNSPVRSTSKVSLALGLSGERNLPDSGSRAPHFAGRPDRLVYETDATNLDTAFQQPPDPDFGIFQFASGDENSAPDVMLAFLDGFLAGSGGVRVSALSVSPSGAFGDRGTILPVAAALASPLDTGRYFVGFLTQSRNLGADDNHAGLNATSLTPLLSFVQDQAPLPTTDFGRAAGVLRARCMPCHAPGGANTAGFNMGNDDDALFFELLNDSRNCPPVTPFVSAGNAAGSLIVQVMQGATCGLNRMPDGLDAVPDELIELVRVWIDNGALQE